MTRQLPIILLAIGLSAGAALGDDAGRDQTDAAKKYLQTVLADEDRAPLAILALRTTKDRKLLPVFSALAKSGDKEMRLFATESLVAVGGEDAAPALLERFKTDPQMTTRTQALAQLIAIDKIPVAELIKATRSGDEKIRLLAARHLVRKKNERVALPVLEKLTGSKDLGTECLARMTLLSMGDAKQRTRLGEIVKDDQTPQAALELLLLQARNEEIGAAAELVRGVIRRQTPSEVKALAYQALGRCSNDAAELTRALAATEALTLRVHILRTLARRDDATPSLQKLANGDDETIAALARVELKSLGGGGAATKALNAALEIGHPIIAEYILDKARRDIAARGRHAGFYAPALLSCIRSAPPHTNAMGSAHRRAAQAATLLADLGTDEAMDGLADILSGKWNAVVRAAAAGTLRTINPDICDVVRPLLKSPYAELATDAALTLGAFGDDDALKPLGEVVANAKRRPVELVTLASWYLLKTAGQADQAAEAMAGVID